MKLENRIKEIGKKCLIGIAAVAVAGTLAALGTGLYYSIKAEIATYSPEFLECNRKCRAQYEYELRTLREEMDEHDCSAEWWEQQLDSSYDLYTVCEKGCDKFKWPKNSNT